MKWFKKRTNETAAAELRSALQAHIASGQWNEAKAAAKVGRAQFPRDPWFAMTQGYIHQQLGEFEDAVAASTTAMQLGSQDWSASFIAGISQRAIGDHGGAAGNLAIAHGLAPANVDTACFLLEEIVAASGIEAGRKIYAEMSSSGLGRRVEATWASLLFLANLHEELDVLSINCRKVTVLSAPAWAEKTKQPIDYLGDAEEINVEDTNIISPQQANRTKTTVFGNRPYVCMVRNATILSKSSMVLTADGYALNDDAGHPRYGEFVDFSHDKSIVCQRGNQMLIDDGQYQMAAIDGAIMLSGAASDAYGHWVPEFLCRLKFLAQHPDFADLPFIVDEEMPQSHFDFLRQMFSNAIVILPKMGGFHCARLLVAPPPSFYPAHLSGNHNIPIHEVGPFSPQCIQFLRERVFDSLPAASRRDRKIYLSRRKRQWRLLLNDTEIAAHLEARGFEIVFPEELTFIEQVRLFQQATVIVGPSGSSWINLMFADPSTQVLVIGQPNLFNFNGFVGPMRMLGYDPQFVCGTEGDHKNKHANYSVAVTRIDEALATFFGLA